MNQIQFFNGPSTNNKVKEHLYTIDPTPFIITIINRWAFLNIVIIDVYVESGH